MTIKARIENGIVTEILDAEPFPPFNEKLIWIECMPEVQVGWTYDGSIFNSSISPTKEQLWSAYQRNAIAILVANDTVAIRCVKANVPYPAEWLACDVALRSIVHASSGDASQPLPMQPIARPVGT